MEHVFKILKGRLRLTQNKTDVPLRSMMDIVMVGKKI